MDSTDTRLAIAVELLAPVGVSTPGGCVMPVGSTTELVVAVSSWMPPCCGDAQVAC